MQVYFPGGNRKTIDNCEFRFVVVIVDSENLWYPKSVLLITKSPELVDHSSIDHSPDTPTLIANELADREGTTVVLLSVDREISERAVAIDQVNATTLQADSEATLGPVVDAASELDGVTVRDTF